MPFNSMEVQKNFEQMDVRYAMTHSIQEVWMSTARAIGAVNEQNLINSAIERLAQSYLEDRTTALLMAALEDTNEEFLGFVFSSDGKQYCVYRRDKQAGPIPFFGVYLMSDDYIPWGVYKIKITGIFRKNVNIGIISRSLIKKTISCSFEDFRPFGNPDRLVASLMTAGQIADLFPDAPQCSSGYSLAHWWLPCRAWLHGILWNG